MTISYPLALPSVGLAGVEIRRGTSGAVSRSPFTGEQQTYVNPGEWWELDLDFVPLRTRADAAELEGWLYAMNGLEGSVLVGHPSYTTVRGTWLGTSPLVNGASQTGKTLAVDGIGAAATVKRGDWFQLGSGSSARLHAIAADGTANGSGELTLDIWPRLRESPANNDPLTISSPKGRFMLASPMDGFSIGQAQVYGFRLSLVEDLRPL